MDDGIVMWIKSYGEGFERHGIVLHTGLGSVITILTLESASSRRNNIQIWADFI